MTTRREYLDRRWTALILLCVAQFVVVLDASIVNVALPSIGKGLHFSEQNLPWVVNAYVIAFGGFLLLGGRAADLLGRRRVFMAGLVVVAVASLAAGFATNQGQLIAARAAQGLGAAIISPAALSIVTTLFRDGAERNKALGAWGAVAGSAGAVGGPDWSLHRDRAAVEGAPGALPDLPVPDPDRRQRRRDPARRVAVLDVLLHLAVHAAGARLQRDPRGPLVPAARDHDHRRGRPRRSTRHEVRLQADPGRGHGVHRGWPRLVQPGVGWRRLPRGHPRP